MSDARHITPPEWIALERRVAELERIHLCGDADRPLSLEETAARIGPGKSAATLRGWMKRPASRRKFRLDMLLRKDPGGRWYSTPRLLTIWTHFLSNQAKQSIYRRCGWSKQKPITPTDRRPEMAAEEMNHQADKAPAAAGAVRKESA